MIESGSVQLRDLQRKLRPFIVKRVATAQDADDVLQEVLLRIHTGLASLQDEDRLGPWVYRITRNAIVDHARARSRQPTVDAGPSADVAQLAASAGDADTTPAEQEVAGYLRLFVASLPEPYRETLELTELDGCTQSDAAARLGISLTATKARVRRGRVLLRRSLEACCALAVDARGTLIDCSPRPDGVLPKGCCE